jgi:uncharacterized protein (DUF2141 family)
MLAAPAVLQAQSQSCKFVAHISGFRNMKGDAGAVLFKTTDGWPEDLNKAFKHGPFPIVDGKATVTFDDVPAGAYAFAVIHDENSNHKLDRNFIGIPKEGFGFANNPHVNLSTPSFKEASVTEACPVTEINVTIQYK